MEVIEIPEWLKGNNFKFNINSVLKDSLYYPCSGLHGKPVRDFIGNTYSFIYVDNGVPIDCFSKSLIKGFKGYKLIYRDSVDLDNLFLKRSIKLKGFNHSKIRLRTHSSIIPYCEWAIFESETEKDENENPKRFSLTFICADGIDTYQLLYLNYNIAPRIISIIQPGAPFQMDEFEEIVFSNKKFLPKYFVLGGYNVSNFEYMSPWEDFKKFVKKIVNKSENYSVWERNYH